MILIVSEAIDQSTTDVIDWLNTFGVSWRRLNGDFLDDLSPFSVRLDGQATTWDLGSNDPLASPADVVWMRRWRSWYTEPLTECFGRAQFPARDAPTACVRLNQFRNAELRALSSPILTILASARRLGNPLKLSLNKQRVLELARGIGFDIPLSLITNSKEAALAFRALHGSLITKPLGEVALVPLAENLYASFTVRCSDRVFDMMPAFFLPTLFQAEVAKAFELRIFYLTGRCYAMAMFTQASEGTAVDFRRYNMAKPSRCVPYSLSDGLANRIQSLMGQLELDTGSLDLIVTPGGQFVFLEVNPVGQFGMTSAPCNYQLERRVAEYLRDLSYVPG